jgi:actin-related protein
VPTFAVPAIYGRISESSQATIMSGSVLAELNSSPDSVLVGNNALLRKALLHLENIMDRGVVTNWSIMSRLIKSVYEEHMFTKADQFAVLLTESTLNPVSNREQFARILFQDFKIPALYFAKGSVLALNAAGLTTGLVVDLGHSSTSIVPIYEGIIIKHACQRLNVAGYDITDQLARMVSAASGVNLTTSSSHREIVRDMKEKLSYVAENPTEEKRKYTIAAALKHLKKPYMLPDGNEVSLAEERWRCCECLFDPSALGMEPENGLAHLIRAAVLACDPDLRNQMLKTIVLAGGTSLLPGLRTRLERELKVLLPDNQVKVVEITKRHFSSWIGGSLLVSSPNFKDLLVPRERYLKEGPTILAKQ